MTWQTSMLLILRDLINDPDSTTYTDARLQQVVVTSAQLLIEEVDWENTYTIDLENKTITPDPYLSGDDGFVNLVCLKAATIILRGEVKVLAGQSFIVRDGPSSISIVDAYKASKAMLDDMNTELYRAIQQFKCGNCVSGKIILSTYLSQFVSNQGDIF